MGETDPRDKAPEKSEGADLKPEDAPEPNKIETPKTSKETPSLEEDEGAVEQDQPTIEAVEGIEVPAVDPEFEANEGAGGADIELEIDDGIGNGDAPFEVEDGDGDGNLPPIDLTEGDGSGLRALCEKHGTTVTKTLNYAKRDTCSWEDDNGNEIEKVSRAIRTRHVQQATTADGSENFFTIPEDSVICDMAIKSTVDDLEYDDVLVLTANDVILISSVNNFKGIQQDKLNTYEWDKFFNQPFDDIPSFCFGTCKIPLTDQLSKIDYSLAKDQAIQLANHLKDQKTLKFEVTTTGDNETDDCSHSGFGIEVDIRWMKQPSPKP